MNKYIYTLMFIIIQGTALSFSGNGSGTAEDPYQITNVHQLQEMDDDHYAYYILMNDIDASETRTWNVRDHDYDPNTPDSATGFEPVGAVMRGLNGNGHIIKNLYINRQSGWGSALITRGGDKGYIINLGIEDCYITGGSNTAALIGAAEQLFRIERCYSTGTIISPVKSPVYIAGLIALNSYADIFSCYSRCEVISNKPIEDQGYIASFCCGISGAIACYTTGKVSLPENDIKVYPFGTNSNFGNSNCYWDIETTGISTEGIPYDHANGRTTEEMMKKSTYKNWDFENVWCIDEGNDYPKLRVFGDCPPVGVEDISEVESLNAYVYPNPAKDIINISIKNEIPSSLKIEIYDSIGNRMKKVIDSPYFPAERYKNVIDVSDFRSGVYHVRIQLNNINLTKYFIVIE